MNTKLSWMRTGLFAFVGVMTMMIMSGCASPGAAGAGGKAAPDANFIVVIHFDANGCPTSVTHPEMDECEDGNPPGDRGFCANRGDFIKWVAGGQTKYPFEVYFDPFVPGRPYKSNPPAQQTSPIKIDDDAAGGEYKYGVLGLDCDEPKKKALDPPIFVEY